MLGKLQLFFKMSREAGLSKTFTYLYRRFIRGHEDEALPNTVSMNRWVWTNMDWSKGGEEWSGSADWKESLIKHVLEAHIPIGSRVLEIGPGAGRWTESLLRRAAHLIAVDVTPKCIEICREKFNGFPNAEFHVNDGRDLSFIPMGSVDRIWSFDVFVHINTVDVENYVRQFSQILAPGGLGIIHHAKNGIYKPAWRSDMTAEKMREFCARHGLVIVTQFDSWDNGRTCAYLGASGERPDIITVFSKPER